METSLSQAWAEGPGSWESHLWGTWAAAALLLYGQGQDGAVLRWAPLTPTWSWLQTQVEKGQEKHLPPSSPALYSGAPNPVAVAVLGKEPIWLGTGKASLGAETVSPPVLTLFLPPSLHFLPRKPQVLFPAGDGQCGLRLRWLEPFLSKSYLIPLLRRLQGWGWRGARVVEAFEPAVGKQSSIKANQWPNQPCPRSC